MKPATIYDVAKQAGVSHQTVTRFLKGFQGIRPETRQRVEAALAELDYRPNSAARMLRSQRSNRLGVIADQLGSSGPARILASASDAARARGYVLDVVIADGASPDSVAASLEVLMGHQVAGIVATAQTEVVLEQLHQLATTLPMVIAPEYLQQPGAPTINENAGRCAADHLLNLGHHRIGYVSGPMLWLAARHRFEGFEQRLLERGGQLAWSREGDWSPESGYAAWQGLARREREVTAVAVGNDSMAIGLMAAALRSGICVPDELSVIGTDDLPEARFTVPALSTIEMNFAEEGRALVEGLIGQIEGWSAGAKTATGEPRLLARGSTSAQ